MAALSGGWQAAAKVGCRVFHLVRKKADATPGPAAGRHEPPAPGAIGVIQDREADRTGPGDRAPTGPATDAPQMPGEDGPSRPRSVRRRPGPTPRSWRPDPGVPDPRASVALRQFRPPGGRIQGCFLPSCVRAPCNRECRQFRLTQGSQISAVAPCREHRGRARPPLCAHAARSSASPFCSCPVKRIGRRRGW